MPVHVVALGDERVSGDVAISDIDAPRDVRPGTRVPVRVTLRSRGFAGQRAELSDPLEIRTERSPDRQAAADAFRRRAHAPSSSSRPIEPKAF